MTRRIMHIDLDAFFVSVEQVFDPSLKGKPVAVGGIPGHGRGVVAAASYEARQFGVHSGMPLREAERRCPKCIFLSGHFERYRDASRKFMAILADFSPFLEPVGIDEAYLEVTGFESLHGTLKAMGEKIRRHIRDEIGIGASIGLASAKIVAKVASKSAKPDGIVEVPDGAEAAFLAPLPIGRLPGIGEQTEKALHGLGIHTLGELARLPRSTLADRFGKYGEVLHDHARGIDRRPVERPAEAKSVSYETTLNEDTRDRDFLEATLRYLSEKTGARLRRYGQKGGVIHIRLRFSDFTTITRQRSLGFATDANEIIYEEALKLFAKALDHSRLPVRLLGVGVGDLGGVETQLPLSGAGAAGFAAIDRALDRIRKKYGFSSIQTGRVMTLGRGSGEGHESHGFSGRIMDQHKGRSADPL
ncbi:DNA polymerase IV [Dehalogenimonas sp. THU2]|uniref:DNA polymerase IV n=1 Tax=Dehalogenimonas sp. THU2 TaxID=3151121 RepID=UPI0032189806